MPKFEDVVGDVNEMLSSPTGAKATEAALEAAATAAGVATATSLIRATSGRRNFAPTPRWGQLWATDIGKPCLRQTYYKVSGTAPDTTSPDDDDGPNGRFLLGDLLEATTKYLIKAAGHHVGNENERIVSARGAWEISGKRDCTIDGWSVDVKSASQFKFAEYQRQGITDKNDIFGYRDQPYFYWNYGGEDGVAGAALLFVEKGSLAMSAHDVRRVPEFTPGEQESRIGNLIKTLNEAHVLGEIAAPRVEREIVQHDKKGPIALIHKACEFCEFRKRCLAGSDIAGTEVGKKKVTYFKVDPTGGY